MNDDEIGLLKALTLKYRRRDQVIQIICGNGSPQKLGHFFLICRNLKSSRKVLLNQALNTLKTKELQKNWVLKPFKIEIQKQVPNNSEVLINEPKIGPFKVLKLKYRRRDQIIQTICRIGLAHKLGPLFLICKNLKSRRKVILNQAKSIEI